MVCSAINYFTDGILLLQWRRKSWCIILVKTDFKLFQLLIIDVELAFVCWHHVEAHLLSVFQMTMVPLSSGLGEECLKVAGLSVALTDQFPWLDLFPILMYIAATFWQFLTSSLMIKAVWSSEISATNHLLHSTSTHKQVQHQNCKFYSKIDLAFSRRIKWMVFKACQCWFSGL